MTEKKARIIAPTIVVVFFTHLCCAFGDPSPSGTGSRWQDLGRVGHLALRAERFCGSEPGDYRSVRLDLHWRDEHGKERAQTLYDGMSVACITAFVEKDEVAFELKGNRFNSEGYKETFYYRWSSAQDRFVSSRTVVYDPWANHLARLQQLLADGRFERARAQLLRMGTSPNGGHTDVSPALAQRIFDAYHEKASELAGDGKISEAADLAMTVLFQPPIQTAANVDEPLIRHAGWESADGESIFPITKTPKHIGMLNDLGFFLAQNKDLQEAEMALTTVLQLAPTRTVAYLNHADVLWAEGRLRDAARQYRSYVDMMTHAQKEDRIPKRAQERMAP